MDTKQIGILIPIENIIVANEAAMMLTNSYAALNTFSDKHVVYREHDKAVYAFAMGTFDANTFSQLGSIMRILEGVYFETDNTEFMFQCLDKGFTFKDA